MPTSPRSWRWSSAAIPAAIQQQRYSPIVKDAPVGHRSRLGAASRIVAAILVAAIGANVVANLQVPAVLDHFPVIGAAVWVAILAHRAAARGPTGALLPEASRARSSCSRWSPAPR